MNVLFIVVDTLRADHLGCYGYGRNTSPNIDALAGESVRFEQMIAPAIPTHPAFTTIHTGQYPITHGVVAHGGTTHVAKTAPWLPSLLQKHGYTTCAVDNLAEWSNSFQRGFEYYIDPTQRHALGLNCDNREMNRRAIPWLEQHAQEQFFLFIHYWDPHTPYLPPRAYRNLFYQGDPCDPANRTLEGMEEHPLGRTWRETWFNKLGNHITDGEYIKALYDSEIRYCDEGVGALLKKLDELNLRERTLVVMMGDHGELMYRHGIFFDHHGLYDGNLHVPLIVRYPQSVPRRIPHMTAHVDIAPTILDLCGIEAPPAMEGISLAPYLRGESNAPARDFVISEECTWQMKWSIRTRDHKLILAREEDFYQTPMRELYNLREDPEERDNYYERDPATAQRLEQQLETWIAEKMRANNLTIDPLTKHGITLGRAWKEQQRRD
ncbi:MAG: sulfatase [Candidatus Hydrogenedentes bacterium]|nr:sulfatase [Candidatus Hydrogenedentota bacterium]